MKKVEKISESEEANLKEIKKYHEKYRERERASGILLSNRGYSPKEIGAIFEISDRMVYNWIDHTKRARKKTYIKKSMKRV